MKNNNIVAGLDIGTTKVCCVIAEETENGLVVKGTGTVPSKGGMRNGLIANIGKMSQAIKEAVGKASEEANVQVNELNIGIAGEHIRSMRYRSYVATSGANGEVKQSDIDRLNEDVKKLISANDMEILHIIPERYFVDEMEVEDPKGFIGKKLEAAHHIILASSAAITNIEKAVELAGYSVRSKVLQPLASSVSVLDKNEKDLGIILIDIGGGTTDIAVFQKGVIRYSGIIAVGGDKITETIRQYFSIVTEEAERVKKEMGYAHKDAILENTTVRVPGVGAKEDVVIQTEILTEIIHRMMKELFEFIDGKLRREKLKRNARGGVVLTGGGAMLRGVNKLAEEIFGMPTKLGLPQNIENKSAAEISRPEFATALGLVQNIPGITSEQIGNRTVKVKKKNFVKKMMEKLGELFEEL
jgi:cell division protein FtsA